MSSLEIYQSQILNSINMGLIVVDANTYYSKEVECFIT